MNLGLLILLFLALPILASAWVRYSNPGADGIKLLLAFSGAFLLSVAVLHMLPELYMEGGEGIGLWILGGFLLQVVLEFFSRGIEHGHVHVHKGHDHTLPLATLLSLCLHSFAEGIPFADPRVHGNLPFVAGVLMHKMPMAIALATVLQRSHVPAGRSWAMIVVFALSVPLGIATGVLGLDLLGGAPILRALGLAIGMLLHISTTIIFESTPDHRFNAKRFITVLAGALLGYFTSH